MAGVIGIIVRFPRFRPPRHQQTTVGQEGLCAAELVTRGLIVDPEHVFRIDPVQPRECYFQLEESGPSSSPQSPNIRTVPRGAVGRRAA
jgi:hypothetical protein